jgi:hypothetical protein
MRLDTTSAACVAAPFLNMFGIILGAALLAKQAGVAAGRLQRHEGDASFMRAKIVTAKFFSENLLPQATAHSAVVTAASPEALLSLNEEELAL